MVSFYMRFIFKIWLLENFGFTVATVLQSADCIQTFLLSKSADSIRLLFGEQTLVQWLNTVHLPTFALSSHKVCQ